MPATLTHLRTAHPWQWNLPRKVLVEHLTKGLEIPKQGWTAQTFAAHGARLITAITRLAFSTQRRAVPVVARVAHTLFKRQMERVISKVLERTRHRVRSAKAESIEITLPQNEGLWVQALNEVFATANLDIVAELMPPIQSVMGQAYSRVSELLAQEADPKRNPAITRESREIAQRITRINDTTREKFRSEISKSIADGQTVVETAERLRDSMTEVHRSRITSIARTETNNAFTQGTVAAYKASETLIAMAVIGCEAREANSPQWKGESTCNYPRIAITELDAFMAVGFHVNHTGVLVASEFRNEDGTVI